MKARISPIFSIVPNWFARDVIIPVLVTRLALLLVARLGFSLAPLSVAFPSAWEIGPDGNKHTVAGHVLATTHPYLNMLSRWDATWYIEIARSGYHYQPGTPSNAAFFPLYPLLIRAAHALLFLPENDYWWLLTGIILSNIALLVALGYFRSLLTIDFPEETVSRAIIYLLIFPTTFFFSSVYSESLFLALSVAAFYYARKNRWVTACILTALATLTRSQGIILLLPLSIEYLAQRNFSAQRVRWNATAFAFVPTALFAFVLFLKLNFGSWTIIFNLQDAWGRRLMCPWYPMAWLLRHAPALSPEHHDKLDFGFLLLLAGAAVFALGQLRLSYTVYLWTAVFFFSCWGMYVSIPRFDLVTFPLFVVLGLIGSRSRVFHLGYCIVSGTLATLFMVIHSQWNWVA